MSTAFIFDASACTGCKACQAACKDRNNLPEGVLWRRVIEVSGGEWVQSGAAWENTVFGYNFSLACNHCVHPKCAGVCPTNAYSVREDGIVLLDSSKCVGCGYCNWACPYAVPQYNNHSGLMSKCNFCYDAIDAGGSPACVAACPLRVLNYYQIRDYDEDSPGVSLWEVSGSKHPFPLPDYSRTQPHIKLNPHPAMSNNLEKRVANQEEIKSRNPKSETPLILFTLLGQMAVGGCWAMQWLFNFIWLANDSPNIYFRGIPIIVVGFSLVLAVLVSFLHLGAKHNAWRTLGNLGKSWLSREILLLGIFSASCFFWLLFQSFWLGWLTSFLGFGLIYSMSNVYRLRSVSAWNSARTLVSFILSAFLLGQFLLMPIVFLESELTAIEVPITYKAMFFCLSITFFAVEVILDFSDTQNRDWKVRLVRFGLILMITVGLAGSLFADQSIQKGVFFLLYLLTFFEEILGRWRFYRELECRIL